MEGERHREEHEQRKDLFGKEVRLRFRWNRQLAVDLHDMPRFATAPIRYSDDISLEDAIHTALLTLKEGFEGEMTEKTIEIGIASVPTAEQMEVKSGERLPATFRKLSEAEVRDYLAL